MGERVEDILSEGTSSKTDLMYEIVYNPDFVPVPSPKVNVKTTDIEGKLSYLMKNHATGLYYELDETMNLIWSLTDGKRTVKEIVAEVQNRKPHVKESDILGNLQFFADANLLVPNPGLLKERRFKVISPFEMRVALIHHSKPFLQSIHNKIHFIFKKPLLWATVIFIVFGVVLFSPRYISILTDKSDFQILGSSVVGFFFYTFIALAPVVAIHEISHGLALVHYGGEPDAMGTGLFYFGPMFYTEVTDAWTLERKRRMMVYVAGIMSTLLIGSAIVFTLLFVKFPQPAELILTMVAFYCFDASLFNFAPPFETDGYYILSDALKNTSLRSESYAYVGSLFKRAVGARTKQKASNLTARKKWTYVGYTMMSVGWIMYIVFHASLMLSYMSQDMSVAVSHVLHAFWTSQALPAVAILITALSVVYFGMQVLGYGAVFLAAVKKAAKKPLRVEAIPNHTLCVFAYLPPQAPESLSNSLRSKMEKTAKKLTHNFEITQVGRSCIAVLRMGEANLAFTNIKDSLKHVENEFSTTYRKLVLDNKHQLQKSLGVYSSAKMKLTRLLEQVATESVSSGYSEAFAVVKACVEKQKEAISYLLTSAFGTVWTIEMQPANQYEIQEEIMPTMLLDDLTLTDLYGDVENFKKSIIYGYDSLAKLAEDTRRDLKECLAQPQEYQLVGLFEPIKSRITFVGRTMELEKKLHLFAPYFLAETWSGYTDFLLTETCCKLDALNNLRVPTAKEMREMSTGELAVLTNDLSELARNQELIDKCIQGSEDTLSRTNLSLRELHDAIKPAENFEIGLLDAAFEVNTENIEAIPSRIRYFRKEWKEVRGKLEEIRKRTEDEYGKRKAEIGWKKRRAFKILPVTTVISVLLATLSFLPPLATFWIPMLSTAVGLQVVCWAAFYHMLTSFHRVTKYPTEAFSSLHLLLLAWTEAIYGYAMTGDILALP